VRSFLGRHYSPYRRFTLSRTENNCVSVRRTNEYQKHQIRGRRCRSPACWSFLLRKHSQDNESCAFDSALASSLLALRLFELPRSRRVTNQPAKRAVYAFACRDQFTPFVADCSLNTRCRSNLVLCLRPARPAFNDGSRRNFTLSTVHCGRWISQIKVEVRCLRQSCCDNRRSEQRTGNSIFR